MSESRDILVGYEVKIDEDPKEITQRFDGEDENINYQKLNDAFKDLKKDLEKHYYELTQKFGSINVKAKHWQD